LSDLRALGFDEFFAAQREPLPAEWVPARVSAEGQSSFHLLGCRAPLADLPGRLLSSQHKVERPVVGDHGDDRFALRRVARRLGEPGAGGDQRLGPTRRPVVDSHLVAGLQQVAGHRLTHVAETDEANLHDEPSCW